MKKTKDLKIPPLRIRCTTCPYTYLMFLYNSAKSVYRLLKWDCWIEDIDRFCVCFLNSYVVQLVLYLKSYSLLFLLPFLSLLGKFNFIKSKIKEKTSWAVQRRFFKRRCYRTYANNSLPKHWIKLCAAVLDFSTNSWRFSVRLLKALLICVIVLCFEKFFKIPFEPLKCPKFSYYSRRHSVE